MLDPDRFATALAWGVDVFRNRPDAAGDKKAVLRSLIGLCTLSPVRICIRGTALEVLQKPIAPGLPSVGTLISQLNAHGISDIQIAQHADPADLLLLLQSLSADPEDWVPMPDGGTVIVTDDALIHPSATAPERARDAVTWFAGLEAERDAPALAGALAWLELEPFGGDVLNRLGIVARGVLQSFSEHQLGPTVEALGTIVRLEKRAPEGSARRAYAIALRRLLVPENLVRLADALHDLRYAPTAGLVFQRAGIPAAEVLVRRLVRSRDVYESKQLLLVLAEFPEAAHLLVPLVNASEWCVAAGVIELLAEFCHEPAVKEMALAIHHEDRRVRQAAGYALARIGSRDAVEHVQRALASPDNLLRSAVAQGVGGRRSGALAMPLLKVAGDDNAGVDVVRDCYRALGRIGTPDALQALIRAAQPGGRVFGKKRASLRLAAIDGLGLIGGPVVQKTLERLTTDRDPDVRTAAGSTLQRLQPGESSPLSRITPHRLDSKNLAL